MEDLSNPDSWRQWFHEHGPHLLLYARLWTRSHADAEDVVQEAFVRFWKHQRQLGGEPRALLLVSIRRAAMDWGRREARRSAREQQVAGDGDHDPWFEPTAGDPGRGERIEAAIRRLPESQQEVLALKIWGELTFEEIARHLDLPPGTVASRYRYALTALRRELNPIDDERSMDRA